MQTAMDNLELGETHGIKKGGAYAPIPPAGVRFGK